MLFADFPVISQTQSLTAIILKISWNLFEYFKLDHLTCSEISVWKLNGINGFIDERHNYQFTFKLCNIFTYNI